MRRNAKVTNDRLRKFCGRVKGFRKLKRAGLDPRRILRTGGVAALTYGQVCGVAPSMLRQQRLAVAAACGQELR